MVHLLSQSFNVCVVVNHDNLTEIVALALTWLQLCHRPHIQEFTILRDKHDGLMLFGCLFSDHLSGPLT